jgi:hypothetical protein
MPDPSDVRTSKSGNYIAVKSPEKSKTKRDITGENP